MVEHIQGSCDTEGLLMLAVCAILTLAPLHAATLQPKRRRLVCITTEANLRAALQEQD